jgi:RNA polymerase sigma factor (sigma-70 family)
VPTNKIEDLLRGLAPQVLGALMRRYGHFDLAEDAVQEALLAASNQWTAEGIPDSPRAWLITVAARRLTDLLRSEQARRRREDLVASWTLPEHQHSPAADRAPAESDDTLIVLFLCCHPALSPASQIALTLRAVGGLSTAEIARAFLVPEATMTRRISRAKQTLAASPRSFTMPTAPDQDSRLAAVLHVLYLIFNEGYAATAGPDLHRPDLAAEAIRLVRVLHHLLRDDPEVAGLLALMLLTHARRDARTTAQGELVPLAEQDRSRWDQEAISEGIALITATLPRGPLGPYQLQAAIAALHDEARTAEDTDWAQISALYDVLARIDDNPIVALNHAVAIAMSPAPEHGPATALERLAALDNDERLARGHRLPAVRAHLLEMLGDQHAAYDAFLTAARRATNLAQQRYLHSRAARLANPTQPIPQPPHHDQQSRP